MTKIPNAIIIGIIGNMQNLESQILENTEIGNKSGIRRKENKILLSLPLYREISIRCR